MNKQNTVLQIIKPVIVLVVGVIASLILNDVDPSLMGCAICLTMGVVFIMVADAIRTVARNTREACSYMTDALVVGYSAGSGDSADFPVYTYTYGGQEYTIRSNISDSLRNPPVGAEVDIFLNPDKPEESFIAHLETTTMIISRVFLAVGAILLVSAVIIFLVIFTVTL